MSRLTLLIFLLVLLIAPSTGRADKPNPLKLETCLNAWGKPATMTLTPDVIPHLWQPVKNANAAPFVALTAKSIIEFGGYAPKGQEYLEWYGNPYGWKGIDQTKLWNTGLLEFYNKSGKLVARAEIKEYPAKDAYLVFITTLNVFTDARGEHKGYHGFTNKNGDACQFMVQSYEFEVALGWEY